MDESSIEKAAKDFGDKPLDLLLNLGGKLMITSSDTKFDVRRTVTSPEVLARTDNPNVHGQISDDGCREFHVICAKLLLKIHKGPFLTCKHFLASLEKATDPKIVNITSEFGSVSSKSIVSS